MTLESDEKKTPPVLIAVEDPGAANVSMNIDRALRRGGYDSMIFAAGTAQDYLVARGVGVHPLPSHDLDGVFEGISPSIALVGTSVNRGSPMMEVIVAAKQRRIPVIGIVDTVISAEYRFRGTTDDPLFYAPDHLFVPDETSAEVYVALGYKRERMTVTGQPQYFSMAEAASKMTVAERGELRSRHFPKAGPDEKIVVLVAEPEVPKGNDYHATEALRGWGETDDRTQVVLQETIDAIDGAESGVYYVVQVHPRDDMARFRAYADHVDDIRQGGDVQNSILAADVVMGMTSSLLFEAAVAGLPAIAVLVTRKEDGLLPDVVRPYLNVVFDRKILRREIHRALDRKVFEKKTTRTALEKARNQFDCFVVSAVDALLGVPEQGNAAMIGEN